MDVACPKCDRYIITRVKTLYDDIHEDKFSMECPHCKTLLFIYVELKPEFYIEEYYKNNET